MHVCLICIELFGLGVHGGFGRATRFLGRELVRRGIQVTVVVPRRSRDFPAVHELDGMIVRQFNPLLPWRVTALCRSVGADVYHSQDTSLGTYLAMRAAPGRRHVITFRDPMDRDDWRMETDLSGKGKFGWGLYRSFIDNPLVASAVRRADGLCCAAEFLIPKVVQKYGLKRPPEFLPTPVAVPDEVSKAERPTVCFVSRWEKRKKPEFFFELARAFPHVDFIAVGGAQDRERDSQLRAVAAGIPNLALTGLIDQFRSNELHEVLSKSWVLVNTSPREGLPNAFLEAAAHRCAILSFADPDRFASRFGCHASEGALGSGLEFLLSGNRWRALGEEGCGHVKRVFAVERAVDAHIALYERLLGPAMAGHSPDRRHG